MDFFGSIHSDQMYDYLWKHYEHFLLQLHVSTLYPYLSLKDDTCSLYLKNISWKPQLGLDFNTDNIIFVTILSRMIQLRGEVTVRFFDIGGIDGHHCLNILFIMQRNIMLSMLICHKPWLLFSNRTKSRRVLKHQKIWKMHLIKQSSMFHVHNLLSYIEKYIEP